MVETWSHLLPLVKCFVLFFVALELLSAEIRVSCLMSEQICVELQSTGTYYWPSPWKESGRDSEKSTEPIRLNTAPLGDSARGPRRTGARGRKLHRPIRMRSGARIHDFMKESEQESAVDNAVSTRTWMRYTYEASDERFVIS